MKKSFGLNKSSLFGSREKDSTESTPPVDASEENVQAGTYGNASAYGMSGSRAPADPYSLNRRDDDTETVIDTLTGYPRVVPPVVKSMTVISNDAEIIGDLKTQGDLKFMGNIEGNIEAKGNMSSSGSINGNVSAGSLLVSGGNITGENLLVSEEIKIESGSAIRCNIAAENLDSSGNINGDITVKQGVTLNETSVVVGNISSKSIIVMEGAKISGTLNIGNAD